MPLLQKILFVKIGRKKNGWAGRFSRFFGFAAIISKKQDKTRAQYTGVDWCL
jgi:hypothetical protein